MADARTFQSFKDFTKTVTIANGQTISDIENIGGAAIVGIITDANITGTEISFQSSVDNITFLDYKGNDATPAVKDIKIAVTAATSEWYGINATDFAGLQYIKLVSNATQTGSDTVITLVLRGTPA
jgi:hypothetical protein